MASRFEDVDGAQLSAEDVAEIKATRVQYMAGRVEPLEFVFPSTSRDPVFGFPDGSDVSVTVSGNVQVVEEEDRLLRLGGRIAAGDLKVVLFWDDVDELLGGFDRLRGATVVRPPGSGTRYLVDVFEEKGLGTPNRTEIGLVRE